MAKGVRSKTEDKASSFLVEVTGMALVLFSILAFLCVVTGEALFWNAGKSVRNFMYGVFGAYTFVFLIHLAMLGVRLVMGRSLIPKDKRLVAFVVRIIIFSIFVILHLSINYSGGLSFEQELGNAFNAPQAGSITVFGAFASLISYPLALVASKLGAILFFSIVLILCVVFLFRGNIQNAFSNKKPKKERRAKQSAEEKPQEQNALPQEEQREEANKRGFFFNEDAPFAFKTKRELAEGRVNNIPLMSGVFEPKNIIDDARVTRQPQPMRAQPEQRQASHVVPDRGRRVNFDNIGQSPMTLGEISKPIPVEKARSNYEDTSISKDVYTIPIKKQGGYSNDRFERTYPQEPPRGEGIRADRGFDRGDDRVAPSNMGGLFDNASRINLEEPATQTVNMGYQNGSTRKARELGNDNFGRRASAVPPTNDEAYPKSEQVNTSRFNSDALSYDDSVEQEDSYKEEAASVTSIPVERARSIRTPSAVPRRSTPEAYEARFDIDSTSGEEPKKPKFNEIDYGDGSIEDMPLNYRYRAPKLEFLNDYTPNDEALWEERKRQEFCKQKIVEVYKKKGIDVQVVNVIAGPTVTRFDISVPDDVMLSEIFSVQRDLSFRLRTSGELVMKNIPKTDLIGIEIASEARRPVGMKEVMRHKNTSKIKFEDGLFFMIGEDVLGQPIYLDLMKMPHLLISGATGTGKSVCLNVMLTSLIYRYSPEDFRLIIVDPKVVEFKAFKGIPHLVFNEIIGLSDNRALPVIDWMVNEMERRYEFIAEKGFKSLKDYNASIDPKTEKKIPYLILLIDEFADFVQAKPENKKKIELAIGRLAQKARAAGISLILATQRPSADVFSTSIKTNIPSRICFKTSSPTDSRVVIDDGGAEKLLSKGDCMYKTTEDGMLKRAQCAFISDGELKTVIDYVKSNNKRYYDSKMLQAINNTAESSTQNEVGASEDLPSSKSSGAKMSLKPEDADDVTRRALRLAIVRHNISSSALRTYLCVGYNKAASIVLWLERMEYISAPLENKTRKPLITREQYEEIFGEEFVEDW